MMSILEFHRGQWLSRHLSLAPVKVSTTAEQNLAAEMDKVLLSCYEIFPNGVAEVTIGF